MPPRSAEHRRKLSEATTRRNLANPTTQRIMREWAQKPVEFNHEMVAEMLRLRKRGWNIEAIAERVGVWRGLISRELHARGAF
jgi:uncharacterized membrane protein